MDFIIMKYENDCLKGFNIYLGQILEFFFLSYFFYFSAYKYRKQFRIFVMNFK